MNRLLTAICFTAACLLSALPGQAQTGTARGKVLDEKGQPLQGAKVVWEFQGGITRKGDVTTNKKGEFIQVGLAPGSYKFTVSVEGYRPQVLEFRIGLGEPTMIPDFQMTKSVAAGGGGGGDPTLEALKVAVNQAIQLANEGKTDEAVALYVDLQAKNPTVYVIPYNLGLLYAGKKDVASAEAAFSKAIELKPDYTDAYLGLSSLYAMNGQAAKGAELLTKAAADHPADGRLLLQLGIILFNSGKSAEAAEVFKKVVASDPQNPEPYYYLGSIAVSENKTAECIENLEKYLSMNPRNPQNAATAKSLIAALKK